MEQPGNFLTKFYKELRRRKVIRVAVVYAVTAWLLIQIAETVIEPLQLPPWVLPLVIIFLSLAFPVALVLAWAFELTPEGLRPERQTQSGSDRPPSASQASGQSVAILPFVDMSPDRDQQYFCDGVAEEILNVLARVRTLHVASRTSSFQFKDRAVDIKEIGQQLAVATVLEGSVRKSGEQLRITAQLINVEDGYHLWSERFDSQMQDIFTIQDDIARSIVDALRVTLSEREKRQLQARTTDSVDAYDYYLRGWNYFYRATRKDMSHALEMFDKAIQEDPRFSRAWSGITAAYAFMYMYMESRAEYRDRAREASEKALALNPDLPESHVSRGMAHLLCHEFEQAESEFRQAIEIEPQLFEAHYFYGRTCLHQGKYRQAADLLVRANEIRPEDYQTLLLLPQVYRALDEPDLEKAAGGRGIEAARNHLKLHPDDARAWYLGSGQLARLGAPEEGKRWAGKALALNPDDGVLLYNIACFYSLTGDVETAIDLLERARLPGMANKDWVEHDADLDPLRDHPRFIKLLQQLKR